MICDAAISSQEEGWETYYTLSGYLSSINSLKAIDLSLPRCTVSAQVLGGSSVLNYMLYVRGNRADYDSWEAAGNPGWGYRSALHYFKKSEDNRNPYLAATPYHGTGGYLTVQEAPWRTPLATAFVEAGVEMGYDNRDGNGEFQTGFMVPQGTIRRGSRCSTSKAFLRPVRHRPNLHVSTNSQVPPQLCSGNKMLYCRVIGAQGADRQ